MQSLMTFYQHIIVDPSVKSPKNVIAVSQSPERSVGGSEAI